MPFYVLCFIIMGAFILLSGLAFINEHILTTVATVVCALIFFGFGCANAPFKLNDDDKYQYLYYEVLISQDKISSTDELNEIQNINEKIKNGKEAQDNYFLKNYNYNNEWAKLDELDEDKAYKSYIEYMEKNND